MIFKEFSKLGEMKVGSDELERSQKFLVGKHGAFLRTYIEKNDPLPSYKSPHNKITVPASFMGKRPSLLKYNLPEVMKDMNQLPGF